MGALSRRTVVAPGWLGLTFLITFLIKVDSRSLFAVADGLAATREIHRVSLVLGRFDLLAQGHFRSNAHLLDFSVHGLGRIEGVRGVERVRHLRTMKLAFGVESPIDRRVEGTEGGPSRFEQFELADRDGHSAPEQPDDAVDEALIRAVGSGTRPATRDLAEDLGVSESTVIRRLARLAARGAIVDLLILHPERLGFTLPVNFLFRAQPQQIEDTVAALAGLRDITALSVVAGEYDLEGMGYFQSDEHLFEFLTSDLSRVPGLVSRSALPILETRKTLYGGVPVLPPDALDRLRPLSSITLI
jgi:Lrp/AsnC family transcriptional regulator for asnA, asnC and gidA